MISQKTPPNLQTYKTCSIFGQEFTLLSYVQLVRLVSHSAAKVQYGKRHTYCPKLFSLALACQSYGSARARVPLASYCSWVLQLARKRKFSCRSNSPQEPLRQNETQNSNSSTYGLVSLREGQIDAGVKKQYTVAAQGDTNQRPVIPKLCLRHLRLCGAELHCDVRVLYAYC